VHVNDRKPRQLGWIAGCCALAMSAGVIAYSAAASAAPQRATMAAISPKPDTPAPFHAAKPASRRTAPDRPAYRYFIEFRSRTALSYGHAYVVYGRLDAKGQMIDPKIGGIHPASTNVIPYMLGHLVPVPAEHGASDGDLDEQYVSARFRVMLNEADYNRTVAYIKELEDSTPVWHAVLYSCISFVADVARFVGLRTPPNGLYPEVFINNLRVMNMKTDEDITLIPRVQWGMAPASPPVEMPAE
jgi:hypothetical protein